VDERLAAESSRPTRDELVRRAKAACGRFRSGSAKRSTLRASRLSRPPDQRIPRPGPALRRTGLPPFRTGGL